MFPSLRFMLAAVLSTLVILVIASSALVSMRGPDMPMALHPIGSRPLIASWQTDDMRSFEARFGPQAMLVNASVQLPPVERPVERAPSRLEFVATANAAVEPTKTIEPAKPAVTVIPDAAAVTVEPVAAPVSIESPVAVAPITVTPPVVVSPVSEAAVPPVAPAVVTPSVVANIEISAADAPKTERSLVVAAIATAPTPAKDPQIATDAPAQLTRRTAAVLPAAPADARPSFVDTSRTELIVKPAIKRRAQIKRPKKRVVRAPAPVAKPATPTNPFAALFGTSTTP